MSQKRDLGITPDVPGTGPATDIPNPRKDPYANEPGAPDIDPAPEKPAEPGKTATKRGAHPFEAKTGVPSGSTGRQSVNPSGPTTGTEGWGLGPNEEDKMANPTGKNPTSSQPEREGGGPLHFRCSDIHSGCNWQTSGRDEQELRSAIERHGREQHGLRDFSQDMWNKAKSTFRRSAA